jgi:hypothetical protein
MLNKRHLIEIVIWLICIAILLSVVFYYKRTNIQESFYQQINQNAIDKKMIDRLKLQTLINKYESNYKCCNGYHQPSNSCSFSFNTNFYPGSYR